MGVHWSCLSLLSPHSSAAAASPADSRLSISGRRTSIINTTAIIVNTQQTLTHAQLQQYIERYNYSTAKNTETHRCSNSSRRDAGVAPHPLPLPCHVYVQPPSPIVKRVIQVDKIKVKRDFSHGFRDDAVSASSQRGETSANHNNGGVNSPVKELQQHDAQVLQQQLQSFKQQQDRDRDRQTTTPQGYVQNTHNAPHDDTRRNDNKTHTDYYHPDEQQAAAAAASHASTTSMEQQERRELANVTATVECVYYYV